MIANWNAQGRSLLFTALTAATALGGCVSYGEIDPDDLEGESVEAAALEMNALDRTLDQGRDHGCSIQGGVVKCWGLSDDGEAGTPPLGSAEVLTPTPIGGISAATKVSTGSNQTCAIAGGQLFCWGKNLHGLVGVGVIDEDMDVFCLDFDAAQPVSLPGAAVDVATGAYHTCALLSSGQVACSGLTNEIASSDTYRFCGSSYGKKVPEVINGIAGAVAIAGEASGPHTCVLKSDGGVLCWGGPAPNLGGASASQPSGNVPGLASVTAIATSGSHACALQSGGTVKCWSSANGWSYGQCGDGRGQFTNCEAPVTVKVSANADLTSVTSIDGGERHFCATRSDGTVWCWGWNDSCSLGHSSGAPISVYAKQASPANLTTAVAVVCGQQTSCARLSNGAMTCWGSNSSGEHGLGTKDTAAHCSAY